MAEAKKKPRAKKEPSSYKLTKLNASGGRETEIVEAEGMSSIDASDGSMVVFILGRQVVHALPYSLFISAQIIPKKPSTITAIK